MPTPQLPWPYPRWIAHRGAGKLAPENTLATFRAGAAFGYRMFECDVKLSADEQPFLLHDATLERTSNGHGTAGAQAWATLATLDAGSWHSPRFAGEPLPSFDTISDFCLAQGHQLNIEIKPTPGSAARTGRLVAQAAAQRWCKAPLPPLLSSFETEALDSAREAAPELPRALLLERLTPGWLAQAQALGCVAIVAQHGLWDADSVAQVRAAGLAWLCYTVNDRDEAARLLALGAHGLITDRVDLFPPDSSGTSPALAL